MSLSSPVAVDSVLKGASGIPESVKARLKHAISKLSQVNAVLSWGRSLDLHFGGEGRYEADSWRPEAVQSAQELIESLRPFAEAKHIDYDLALKELGFIGYPELSEKAQEWLFDA